MNIQSKQGILPIFTPTITCSMMLKKQVFVLISFLQIAVAIIAQDSTGLQTEAFSIDRFSEAVEETEFKLRNLDKNAADRSDLNKLFEILDQSLAKSRELDIDSIEVEFEQMNLLELKDELQNWERFMAEIESIEKGSKLLSEQLSADKNVISSYRKRWELTRAEAVEKESAEVLLTRIEELLKYMEEMEGKHLEKENEYFVFVDTLTRVKLKVIGVIDQIRVAENKMRSDILFQDSPKYFDLESNPQDSTSIFTAIGQAWSNAHQLNVKYLKGKTFNLWSHVFLFFGLMAFFIFLRSELRKMGDTALKEEILFIRLINSPVLLALIIALFLSFWIYNNRPSTLSEQIIIVMIFPVIYLLSPLTHASVRIALYSMAFLFLADKLQYFMIGQPFAQRNLLMVEGLVGLILSAYLMISFYLKDVVKNRWAGVYQWATPILFILFGTAIYANIVGSVQFSRLLTSAVTRSATVAVVLYMVVMMVEGLMEFLIVSRWGQGIKTIQEKEKSLRFWTKLIARTWAIYLWFFATLSQLRLDRSFSEWWEEFMSLGWEFGDVSLSIGLLVDFVLIVVVFTMVANFLRHLLEIEILPRFNLKRGIPMAIGIVTRYFILILGFFMAVAAAGISLDKLGFLAGALGVGIGFGLQNVVNNFVSGLILVFERPVLVGDVVTAGDVEGTVNEIGIRSSKIRTWDGAEVIVPNSDLVSFKVTNWTLSDTKRRRELVLKLQSGSDPVKVIEIVKGVLDRNPDVLKDPGALVLFQGQSSYSFDFRVLYWISARLLLADSEVTLEIYEALKKSGFNISVPTQHLIAEENKPDAAKGLVKKAAPKKTDPDKPATS
ncbi:MAG: mechanosensitive ion channel [Vicingaceae bacterium]